MNNFEYACLLCMEDYNAIIILEHGYGIHKDRINKHLYCYRYDTIG